MCGANTSGHSASTLPGAVRRATGRFLDVDDAIAEGYVQFQGCVSGQDLGAMGVHYVNPASSTIGSRSISPRPWSTNRSEAAGSNSSRSNTSRLPRRGRAAMTISCCRT